MSSRIARTSSASFTNSNQWEAMVAYSARATHANARPGRSTSPQENRRRDSRRRTYISIALLANNFDVKWVMAQVGHADSRMTMDVYEQRAKREHDESVSPLPVRLFGGVARPRLELGTPRFSVVCSTN